MIVGLEQEGGSLCVCVYIYIYIYIYIHFLYKFCFLWLTNCVLLSDDKSLIPGCLWLLAFVLSNTLILGIWCSTIPHLPGCFCPWTFFQNIGFNMVPLDPQALHRPSHTWHSHHAGSGVGCVMYTLEGRKRSSGPAGNFARNDRRTA